MPVKLTYSLTNIKMDKVGFDIAFNEPTGEVGRWMHRRGWVALRQAKGEVGVRTGKLRTAIDMKHDRKGPGRQQRVRIGTFVGRHGYAYYHHQGTPPHMIMSTKVGRLMTFNVRGKRVFMRVVRHPGTKGNPYLTNTFKVFMGP